MQRIFTFKSKVWLYQGNSPWHFVTLPKKTSEEINYYFAHAKRGWGSLPVAVTVGGTIWKTSIFPDKPSASYILPIKKEVRQSENIKNKDIVQLKLLLND